MTPGFFTTGTDTDVGKTLVTALLLHAMLQRGISARPVKPVQSGCEEQDGVVIAPDIEFALRVAGLHLSATEKDALCPYKLMTPCSPHLAAEREEQSIDWNHLLRLPQNPDWSTHTLVVEGAGGLLVPIDREHTMLDLIAAYSFPVVLTARAELGTLNHTLLSVEALRARQIPIAGIVINQTQPTHETFIIEDNIQTLRSITQLPVLGPIPFLPDFAIENTENLRKLSDLVVPLLGTVE